MKARPLSTCSLRGRLRDPGNSSIDEELHFKAIKFLVKQLTNLNVVFVAAGEMTEV